jgi:hypothetical protein
VPAQHRDEVVVEADRAVAVALGRSDDELAIDVGDRLRDDGPAALELLESHRWHSVEVSDGRGPAGERNLFDRGAVGGIPDDLRARIGGELVGDRRASGPADRELAGVDGAVDLDELAEDSGGTE